MDDQNFQHYTVFKHLKRVQAKLITTVQTINVLTKNLNIYSLACPSHGFCFYGHVIDKNGCKTTCLPKCKFLSLQHTCNACSICYLFCIICSPYLYVFCELFCTNMFSLSKTYIFCSGLAYYQPTVTRQQPLI